MRSRTTIFATAALLSAGALSGCGGALPTAAAGGKENAVYAEIAALPKQQQRDRARELAKDEGGTLTLYTSMTADIVTPLAEAFEKDTGIHVNVFRGNSETVLQRTLQEAQARKAGTDVVETNFREMVALADNELLAKYDGSALDKVEKTGKFDTWTATRLNIFHPAWNTKQIQPGEEPRSWEELADPKYKGRITLEVSDSDWYENVTKYWLDHGRTQAEVDALWKKIVANAKVAKGHTTMMQFLTSGQTDMEVMNYTYITARAAAQGAPVTFLPSSGKSTVPAFPRPNGVGMLKAAQHPASAWLFYDWMLTGGQKELVKLHLTPSTKVPGDKSLDGLSLAPFDVEGLSHDQGTWDKKYDALLRGVDTVGK
ncbi:extracellular solute-binding protein [Streptomyces sp. RS2]|uniref:ABC transporter substrate-binding protein n=1 Tax=Streptomyces sp. RS2 TaxID=1451205 RepID=UPI0021F8E24C|nr:extracellular solute-binding protein [Streptomyces sp. RS2]MCW1097446.1 extracellular solute-binding protein [Streptomyces sp. RS2]